MDTYEKKYKEAVNKIKNLLDDGEKNGFTIVTYKTDLESIFPELKESEDERIRKEIIAWLKNSEGQTLPIDRYNAALAWLEKQDEQKQEINNFDVFPGLYKCVHRMFDGTPDGRLLFEVGNVYRCLSKHDRAEFEVSYGHSVYLEDPVVCKHFIPFEKQSEQKSQRMISAEAKEAMYDKPSDKIEPKFNVGDWVVYYRNDSSREVLQVYDIRDSRYYFTDNVHFSWSVKECDEKSHLWSISDARAGDVLVYKDEIFLFNCMNNNSVLFHCCYDDNELITDSLYAFIDKELSDVHPATKEQRDLLFAKMKEAGYEWDADKKELKKASKKKL